MKSFFKQFSLFDLAEEADSKSSSVSNESHDAKQDLSLGSSSETEEKPLQEAGEADEEAQELAEGFRRLLEPETLARLKSMAPVEVSPWERVLEPEKFIRWTLFELETGRSQVLTAARERAKRFLKIMEKQKAAQR